MDKWQRAAAYADRIESELRAMEAWRSDPLPDSAFESDRAFFADTMTFFQWLQFVLLPRVREVVGERDKFPRQSQVGAYAVRELDGYDDAADLVTLLCEFDAFIEGRHAGSAPPKLHTAVAVLPPEPPPAAFVEPAESVTRRYWTTRDPQLLHPAPHSPSGMDTGLAERVFASATAFVEICGEPEPAEYGVVVRTVLRADRGDWVVLTALCQDRDEWRVDLPLSIHRTMMMFLRQHHIHPPYTDVEDARGRAMRFWQQVANHNERWARELVLPGSGEIPLLGEGHIDEFFWYLDQTGDGDTVTVRVLMNTHDQCLVWFTRMVRKEAWLVDLSATLEATNA